MSKCHCLNKRWDSSGPEYQVFSKKMREVLVRVLHDIKYWQTQKEKRKSKRAVNAAIEKVKSALMKNPELAALVGLPINESEGKPNPKPEKPQTAVKRIRKTPVQKQMIAKVLGPSAVIAKLKMGKKGLNCQLDHFGKDFPESFSEGTIIYINEDHPLFIRESKNRERHIFNLTRLLTQELSLLHNPKNPRKAFDFQSRLLTDALVERK